MTDNNNNNNNNNSNNMNIGLENEWTVQVFRHSLASGWQGLRATTTTTTTTKDNDNDKNKNHRSTTRVRATPRKGSIVIRRLRLRVLLQDDTVLTRRQNCLRIQSSGSSSVRILVLRFRNVAACQGFGDKLLQLNPLSLSLQQQHDDDDDDLLPYVTTATPTTTTMSPTAAANQRASVLFYIARLLCDADFLKVVSGLEHSLLSSTDGRRLLEDLMVPPNEAAANDVSPSPAEAEQNC